MKVTTAAQMRSIDKETIEQFGIPGVVLMENAGMQIVRFIETRYKSLHGLKVCILAGKGNNGGDGFVVARHLHNAGSKVKVFVVATKGDIGGDARVNLDILLQMGVDVLEVATERDWDKLKMALSFSELLIDALLGTGFKGTLAAPFEQIIDIINRQGKPVIAIDIPSGLDANTGQVQKAVKASYTVTLALPKQGLLIYPGADYVGELIVADIGIPRCLLIAADIGQNSIDIASIRQSLPKRQAWAHKGDCGRVLVIAGSRGMTGAAYLAASGALRAGAGLVTLGIGKTLHDIMEVKLTEAMTTPLPDNEGNISMDALEEILQLAAVRDVVALGPGLGSDGETMIVVRELIKKIEGPLVIDADAINALAGHTDILQEAKSLPILTPHPGELARITGLSISEINADRVRSARECAQLLGSILVLKGAGTVVAFPDGEVYINTTGNAGMATGGSGDVLTGVIAGFLAQGLSSHDAALCGVYVHGLAGDIVAQKGMLGMVAGDLLPAIPAAIYGIQG